jgi:hypothetical protein
MPSALPAICTDAQGMRGGGRRREGSREVSQGRRGGGPARRSSSRCGTRSCPCRARRRCSRRSAPRHQACREQATGLRENAEGIRRPRGSGGECNCRQHLRVPGDRPVPLVVRAGLHVRPEGAQAQRTRALGDRLSQAVQRAQALVAVHAGDLGAEFGVGEDRGPRRAHVGGRGERRIGGNRSGWVL